MVHNFQPTQLVQRSDVLFWMKYGPTKMRCDGKCDKSRRTLLTFFKNTIHKRIAGSLASQVPIIIYFPKPRGVATIV